MKKVKVKTDQVIKTNPVMRKESGGFFTENERLKSEQPEYVKTLEQLAKVAQEKNEQPEEIAQPEQSESEKLEMIEWRLEQFAKKHGLRFERNMTKETFELDGEKFEIDLLITEHKMRAQRKRKTRKVLANVALFALIFTLIRVYADLSILRSFLGTVIIQMAIGTIRLYITYLKSRKKNEN